MANTPRHGRSTASEDATEAYDDTTSDATRITFNEDTESWIAASPAAGATRVSTPEEAAAAGERVDAELGGDRPTTVMAGTGTRVMSQDELDAAGSPHRRAAQSEGRAAAAQAGDRTSAREESARAGVEPTVLQPRVAVQPDETAAAPRSGRGGSDGSAGSTEPLKRSSKAGGKGEHRKKHRVLSFFGRVLKFLLKFVLKLVVIVVVLALVAAVGLAALGSVAPDLETILQEQAIELLGGLAEDAAEDASEVAEDLAESAGTGTSSSSGTSTSSGAGDTSSSSDGASSSSSGTGTGASSSSGTSSGADAGASSDTSDQGASNSSDAGSSSSGADSASDSTSSSSSTSDASSAGAAPTDASASDGSVDDASAGETAE